MSDIVLVDNAAYSFGHQIDNGIPMLPFYNNKNDKELLHLQNYLKTMTDVKDVREVVKKTFKFSSYSTYDTLDKLFEKVTL